MSLLPLSSSTATTNNASLSRRANAPFSNTTSKRPSYISCKQQPLLENNPSNGNNVIDRRNVLLGLSGVYGATATIGNSALAKPVQPPELGKCHLATDDQIPEGQPKEVKCCPPKYGNTKIVDFKPPKFKQLRTRLPAHKLDSEYVAKYEEAMWRMKALPADHPWNFDQQAQCFSMAPFLCHFGERILGKLIDDPTFAIPFWNWDTPRGMYMPSIYTDPKSPLCY